MTARSSAENSDACSRVRQHGEERLLVRELAAEGVGHADRARRARIDEGAALGRPGQDVVDEHAAVHEIDLRALRGQGAVGEHQLARIADDRRDAAPMNASRRISNSVQVGTSRQSTIAIVGGLAVPPHSV